MKFKREFGWLMGVYEFDEEEGDSFPAMDKDNNFS
jgi:hypothetical protein